MFHSHLADDISIQWINALIMVVQCYNINMVVHYVENDMLNILDLL